MANTILWDAELGSPTSYLSTALDSLANDGIKFGAEFTTSQKKRIAIELSIAAQGSARSSGAHVQVYIVPSIDGGTTYAYGSDSLAPSMNHLKGAFQLDAATSARVDIVEGVELGAGRYKIAVVNKTGQAFASSGNTVRYGLYTDEVQ